MQDDVAFMKALAEHSVSQSGADKERIFVTGMSAGAMMAQRLGCDAADSFAAIAAVEGDLMDNSTCDVKPAKQVPYLGFCGSLDFVCLGMGTTFKATTDDWARRNGCDMRKAPAVRKASKTTTCQSFKGCAQAVEACSVKAMGHEWPGSTTGNPGTAPRAGLDASAFIFDFFDNVKR